MRLLTQFQILSISIFLFLGKILPCFAWDISDPNDRSKQCGRLFFQSNFQGPFIQLKDDESILDLTDLQYHYSGNNNALASEQGHENETIGETIPQNQSVSFNVQQGCVLKLSSSTYLKHEVYEFDADSQALGVFMPKSVSCECPKVLVVVWYYFIRFQIFRCSIILCVL